MNDDAAACWIVIASADHVRQAVEGGFVQAGHGKRSGVEKLAKGDGIAAYAPREAMRSGEPVQAFVAIGTVTDDAPRGVDRGEKGIHHRRSVAWRKRARPASVRPLTTKLAFVKDRENWGMAFRRGLFRIEPADMAIIAEAMGTPGP